MNSILEKFSTLPILLHLNFKVGFFTSGRFESPPKISPGNMEPVKEVEVKGAMMEEPQNGPEIRIGVKGQGSMEESQSSTSSTGLLPPESPAKEVKYKKMGSPWVEVPKVTILYTKPLEQRRKKMRDRAALKKVNVVGAALIDPRDEPFSATQNKLGFPINLDQRNSLKQFAEPTKFPFNSRALRISNIKQMSKEEVEKLKQGLRIDKSEQPMLKKPRAQGEEN